jgi:hypothetical protein
MCLSVRVWLVLQPWNFEALNKWRWDDWDLKSSGMWRWVTTARRFERKLCLQLQGRKVHTHTEPAACKQLRHVKPSAAPHFRDTPAHLPLLAGLASQPPAGGAHAALSGPLTLQVKAVYHSKRPEQRHISEDNRCDKLRSCQHVKFVLVAHFSTELCRCLKTDVPSWWASILVLQFSAEQEFAGLRQGYYCIRVSTVTDHVTGATIFTRCSTAVFIILSWFKIIY